MDPTRCSIDDCNSYHNGSGICNKHANEGNSGELTEDQKKDIIDKRLEKQLKEAKETAVVYQALAETLEKDLAVSGGSGILCKTSFGEFHVCTHGKSGDGYIGIDGFYINAEDSKYVSQVIDTFRESFPCSCCRL